jgi:hypothetical protein
MKGHYERLHTVHRLHELFKRLHGQPITAEEIERERERREHGFTFGDDGERRWSLLGTLEIQAMVCVFKPNHPA